MKLDLDGVELLNELNPLKEAIMIADKYENVTIKEPKYALDLHKVNLIISDMCLSLHFR